MFNNNWFSPKLSPAGSSLFIGSSSPSGSKVASPSVNSGSAPSQPCSNDASSKFVILKSRDQLKNPKLNSRLAIKPAVSAPVTGSKIHEGKPERSLKRINPSLSPSGRNPLRVPKTPPPTFAFTTPVLMPPVAVNPARRIAIGRDVIIMSDAMSIIVRLSSSGTRASMKKESAILLSPIKPNVSNPKSISIAPPMTPPIFAPSGPMIGKNC